MKKNSFLFASVLILLTASCKKANTDVQYAEVVSEPVHMVVCGLGPAENDNVQLYDFDQESGDFTQLCTLSGIADPSYVKIDTKDDMLYFASEMNNDSDALVAASLTKLQGNWQMQIIDSKRTMSMSPCYVNIDKANGIAYTANYNGGSFTVYSIDQQTGAIRNNLRVVEYNGNGPVVGHQETSHIHCIEFTPDSIWMLANDLGADRIHMIRRRAWLNGGEDADTTGVSHDVVLEAGSGPRHITFAPSGKFAYVMNELSGKVTVLSYDGLNLQPIQYAVSDSVGGQGSADIHITRDGQFLYASNRLKADGISIFSVDEVHGRIVKVGYQLTGIHPRNFALTPNDHYLLCACRDSNVIQIFERDSQTGLLTDTGKKIEMSKPVCVKFF